MAWPILDRPDLITASLAVLRGRPARAVVLGGPSGIGKTTIARGVADAWERDGKTVQRVVGLDELHGAPLAPFVPVLSGLGWTPEAVSGMNAREVIAAVGALAPEALLVVDDAPLIDETSAAVLYHLVRAYGLPTLVTARSGHPVRGALERLVHEGLTEYVEVGGLSRAEVADLLKTKFGAALRPDDVSRLEQQSAGNPLHLRELVTLAERWGLTRSVAAGIEIDPVEVRGGLDASVADRIEQLSDVELAVVRLVALGAGAPAEVLLREPGERAVAEKLIGDGLMFRSQDGTVRIAHPAYGEAALPLARAPRDELLTEVAARLEASADDTLRFTATRLRCQTATGPSRTELEWAVRRAFARGEHLVAVELGQRARQLAPDVPLAFPAAVDEASSLSALGDLDAADTAFVAAEEVAAHSADRALLTSRWGSHLAYRRFDVDAALGLAARIGPTLVDGDRALIGPDVRTWRTLAGEVVAERRDPALAVEPGAPADAVIRAAIAAVMLDSMGGRAADEAVEILDRVEREHGILDPFVADIVHLQRYFALLSAGRGAEAEAVCEERRAVCTPDAVGMWSLTLGIHRMYSGSLESADGLAALAIEQLRWRDPLGLLGFAIALGALVRAEVGDHGGAESLIATLLPAQLGDPKAAILAAEARAHLRYVQGDLDGAVAEIVEAAAAARSAGFDLVAAIGLGRCVRFGQAAAALPLLREIRASVEPGMGALYAALEDAAAGLVEKRPAVVHDAAVRLHRAGMTATALDALLLAQKAASGAGAGELRRRIERTRAELAVPGFRPLQDDEPDDLSAREWEVVDLVRERLASREIADRLGISVRTVDNHLASIYRKFGVRGRAALRAALEAD